MRSDRKLEKEELTSAEFTSTIYHIHDMGNYQG